MREMWLSEVKKVAQSSIKIKVEGTWIPGQLCWLAEPMPISILSKGNCQGSLIREVTSSKTIFFEGKE